MLFKMFNSKWIISFMWTAVLCQGAKLPDFINKCSRNDPNINECIRTSGNRAIEHLADGLNRYRIPSLRPLKVPFIRVNVDTNLGFNISDMEITGLDRLHKDKVESDFEKRLLKFSFTIPRMEVLGDYVISGRILILPINGNGPMNTTFVNHKVDFSFDYDLESRNGKEYMVPKNPKYIVTHNDRVYYHLDNLFNGNQLLGDQMNKFLNENWKEVNGEIGDRLADVIGSLIIGILKGFMSKVPFKEVFMYK